MMVFRKVPNLIKDGIQEIRLENVVGTNDTGIGHGIGLLK
jgi:hypothetical protein